VSKTSQSPLRTDWEETTLGAICSKPQYGWTTSASNSGELKLLRTTDITSGTIDWSRVPFCRDAPDDIDKYLLHDGDIVISRAGSVGVSNRITNPERAVFASYLIRFRPKSSVNGKYMAYYLQSPAYWAQVRGNTAGIAVPNVNASKLESFLFPLAPVGEQGRIVAEIEKQFTRLEAGVAVLRRAQANLKRYRAAVLKAACEGKLVPTEAELAHQEGRVYETGAQLLDRILTERRQRWNGKGSYKDPLKPDTENLPTLPEGWVWATLDQAFVVERGRFSIRPRNDPRYYGGPHPFVQIGDLPRDGGNILRYSQSLNDEGLKVSKKFRSGTILIAIVGATIANTGVLTFDSCCPDSLVAVQSDSAVRLRLCEIYLRSIKLRLRSVSYASGGQPNINLATLLPLPMPMPPLGEQERIIAELERRLSVVEELEAVVNNNFQRATRLRQSILQRAFNRKMFANRPMRSRAEHFSIDAATSSSGARK
jgi:type I restriction enzyme S subunit